MKNILKLILGSLLLAGLQLGLSSCAKQGYASENVYYGPQRDPWFQDGPWMDGPRWYSPDSVRGREGVNVYPPRYRR